MGYQFRDLFLWITSFAAIGNMQKKKKNDCQLLSGLCNSDDCFKRQIFIKNGMDRTDKLQQ